MSSVIPSSRDWMYKRLTQNRALIPEFMVGVMGFVEYASGRDEYRRNNNTMRCPCEKCKCKKLWKSSEEVAIDLMVYRVHAGLLCMEMSWRGGCQYFDYDTRKQLARGSTSRTPITRTNGGGYRGSFIYFQRHGC